MTQNTRSIRLAALTIALLLAVTAWAGAAKAEGGQQTTTLLTPSGQPVGGWWQKWLNDSYMPTYNGSMVLDLAANASDCGYRAGVSVNACTAATGITPEVSQVQSLPETVVNIGALMGVSQAQFLRDAKWTLLYEQAHALDFAYLTDTDRAAFAALWGRPVPAGTDVDTWWWQGEQANAFGTLGEWFSADYMICAVWPKLTWSILDFNAWGLSQQWDGMDPISLSDLHIFPVLNDYRAVSDLTTPKGKFLRLLYSPPTRREELTFRTQQRSCGLIRSWLTPA